MANQTELNSREKTLGENVIIIALITVLMASFLYYFFKQEQRFTEVGFDAVARNFSSSVMAVRAQWFMDGQPDEVVLKEKDQPTLVLKVNNKGWIDFSGEKDSCQKIWQTLMATDLSFLNQPIVVVEIKNELQGNIKNICRYSLSSGESFDYQIETGKVTAVEIKN
ncbi:MAG: hypothetical protein KC484_11960 [Colwelliaceae bacterium]|jgi:hypothetical protein|nr:hypothetical protein [Colwelliaceae bacterium]